MAKRITDPDKQKEFVSIIITYLADEAKRQDITLNMLEEAKEYTNKLKGKNTIKDADKKTIETALKTAKLIALMPTVPKQPHGYLSNAKNQRFFLNNIISRNKSKTIHKTKNKNLSEALYYANTLHNSEAYSTLFKEQIRRSPVLFRPPEHTRPNMPLEAVLAIIDNTYFDLLVNRILDVSSDSADKAKAFEIINNIYLTDWVDRNGFLNKNGIKKAYRPFFDSPEFLTSMENYIEKLLKTTMQDWPNPGTVKKLPRNSLRQQYFKDILERIQKRLTQLADEATYIMEKRHRNRNGKSSKGGRITRKHSYVKRRKTIRN
jgi:hypothetical protein